MRGGERQAVAAAVGERAKGEEAGGETQGEERPAAAKEELGWQVDAA
jgi:hypothetical protein